MVNLDYFECGNRVRITCGADSLQVIPKLLGHVKARRPMLISDPHVSEAGLVDLVSQHVSVDIEPISIVETTPAISSVAEVHRIAQIFSQNGCDAILAVGGGSVIDTAKGVNLAVAEEVEEITRLSGYGALRHPLLPLIAIPTTASSGSEVSGTVVLSDAMEHRKWFFISSFIIPFAVVIDPAMTAALPVDTIAAGAMTALSHAVEAALSEARNPVGNANAVSAIRLIKANLFNVMRHPEDSAGRIGLALAACQAGMALTNAMAGSVYALGHGISALCQIPYNLCTAILLPYGLCFSLPKIRPIAEKLLLHLAGPEEYVQTPPHLRAEQLVILIQKMNHELSELTQGRFATSLSALNQPNERPKIPQDILNAVANAAHDNTALFFNPQITAKSELLQILEHAWEGKNLDKSSKNIMDT